MTLTPETDRTTALAAIRAQREVASQTLEILMLYSRLTPRGECRQFMAGPMSLAYLSDIAELGSNLSAVRNGLASAIDDLWVAIGEAGDD